MKRRAWSQGGGRRNESTRHLIRLAILLALVVVLMKDGVQPRFFEPFFADAPPSDPRGFTRTVAVKNVLVTTDDARSSDDVQSNQTPSSVDSTGVHSAGVDSDVSIDDLVDAFWSSADRDAREELMAVSIGVRPVDPESSLIEAALSEVVSRQPDRVATAVFDRLNQSVVDGTEYRSGDNDAMQFLLGAAARSRWAFDRVVVDVPHAIQVPRQISVTPLLQQPDVYRGTMAEVRGRVARIDRIDAVDHPLSPGPTFQVWIRPRSGVDRPVVFCTPNLPASVLRSIGDRFGENVSRGEDVIARGIVLKRLAYRSGVGVDVAPVLVGRLATRFDSSNPMGDNAVGNDAAGNNAAGVDAADDVNAGGIAFYLAIAGLVGVLAAGTIMMLTRSGERRLQRLRSQSEVDLTHLQTPESIDPQTDA